MQEGTRIYFRIIMFDFRRYYKFTCNNLESWGCSWGFGIYREMRLWKRVLYVEQKHNPGTVAPSSRLNYSALLFLDTDVKVVSKGVKIFIEWYLVKRKVEHTHGISNDKQLNQICDGKNFNALSKTILILTNVKVFLIAGIISRSHIPLTAFGKAIFKN